MELVATVILMVSLAVTNVTTQGAIEQQQKYIEEIEQKNADLEIQLSEQENRIRDLEMKYKYEVARK
jgi:septal ring factor EnvC (AmiA/AmiB activator)